MEHMLEGQPQEAQKQNDENVEIAALAEKFDLPVEATKGICGIFDEIRNGLGNAEAMEKIKVLSENDFETEETQS